MNCLRAPRNQHSSRDLVYFPDEDLDPVVLQTHLPSTLVLKFQTVLFLFFFFFFLVGVGFKNRVLPLKGD
jgi:hypothetical protein